MSRAESIKAIRSRMLLMSKSELTEFGIESIRTIEGMKKRLDRARRLVTLFQEGQLKVEFRPETHVHEFAFGITSDLVAVDPDVTELATVIAVKVADYIRSVTEQNAGDIGGEMPS
jgi:hypothetical protein